MKKSIVLLIVGLISLSGLIVAIALSSRSQDANDDTKVRVLVSILPQIEFVNAVGGDKVQVKELVPPGESPESYSLTASDLVEVENADIYFRIGYIPFENANIDSIQEINPDLTIVPISDAINLRYFTSNEAHEHEEGEEDHDDEEAENHSEDEREIDPHLWLSVENMKLHVASIANELSELDPENAEYYKNNAENYTIALEDLQKEFAEELSTIEEKHLLVFHPAWGYLADEFGFEQIAVENDGNEPTADQIAGIIDFARENEIGVLFVQLQFSTSAAESIANELEIPVVQINPLAEDYIENMRTIAKTLHEHL